MGNAMKYFSITKTDTIPALGLGTWKSSTGEVAQAVSEAIKIGYRHIDCASIYQNQKEIGTALGKSLATDQVNREELWITSKLWNNAHAKKHVQPALERTLKDLHLWATSTTIPGLFVALGLLSNCRKLASNGTSKKSPSQCPRRVTSSSDA